MDCADPRHKKIQPLERKCRSGGYPADGVGSSGDRRRYCRYERINIQNNGPALWRGFCINHGDYMEKHMAHIQENLEIFDFKLTDEEMAQMIAVDRNERFADYQACTKQGLPTLPLLA